MNIQLLFPSEMTCQIAVSTIHKVFIFLLCFSSFDLDFNFERDPTEIYEYVREIFIIYHFELVFNFILILFIWCFALLFSPFLSSKENVVYKGIANLFS